MSTSPRNVFIVGGSLEYAEMFRMRGWGVTDSLGSADLIQFTGGSDVSPSLYGQGKHPTTHHNPERDKKEALIFKLCVEHLSVPMAGICRGGQFLNVMCGGSLWQHVNNHAVNGTHEAIDAETGEVVQVTSTHHQMMRPAEKNPSKLILWADEATSKEMCSPNGHVIRCRDKSDLDVEALFYPEQNAFCFQPHPEFKGRTALADYYFRCLERCFGKSVLHIVH